MGKFYKRDSERRGDSRFATGNKHRVVCAECGKDCEVPFKPSGNKPVYCSSCFEKEGGSSSNRRDGKNYGSSEKKEMFSAVCAECDKKCEIPFRPRSGKPVYCSSCFEKIDPNRESRNTRDSEGSYEKSKNPFDMSLIRDQLISVNVKLDKLINILTPVKEEAKRDEVVVQKKTKGTIKKSVTKEKSAKGKIAKKSGKTILKKEKPKQSKKK